jgi:hypothetical protein
MSILSHRLHGVLDYATVVFLALAPTLFGLTGLTAYIAYGLAVAHLTVTVFTDFPLGLAGLIPPKLHAAVELVVGVSLLTAPWLASTLFAGGQVFFTAFGGVVLGLWAVTDYAGFSST